jgi:hypothetical protein
MRPCLSSGTCLGVCHSHGAFIVPNGYFTVSRRWCIACGLASNALAAATGATVLAASRNLLCGAKLPWLSRLRSRGHRSGMRSVERSQPVDWLAGDGEMAARIRALAGRNHRSVH